MPFKQSKSKQKHSWQFGAIGTEWLVETAEELTVATKQVITERIEQFDRTYSRFRSDSIVSDMAHVAGSFKLPNDSIALGEFYKQLYDATDGAMSPLVGVSLESAGYDKDYSLQANEPKGAPRWDSALRWDDASITTKQPIVLDVGAAGKGLLVDEISTMLEDTGINEYVVDASGDVRTRGTEQRIGLENPLDPTTVIGVAHITDKSLCASATNRRAWGNGWHHVLDARTGKPVKDVLATWVVAETTMIADGIATALFFASGDALQHIAPFEFIRLLADGTVEYSKGFVGELYI